MCLFVLYSGGNVKHALLRRRCCTSWIEFRNRLPQQIQKEDGERSFSGNDDDCCYRSDFNKDLNSAPTKAIGNVIMLPLYSFNLFAILPPVAHMPLLLQLLCNGPKYGHVPGISQELQSDRHIF